MHMSYCGDWQWQAADNVRENTVFIKLFVFCKTTTNGELSLTANFFPD